MNITELHRLLQEEDFDPRAYSLGGGQSDNQLCLSQGEEGWLVYYVKQGARVDEQIFDSEAGACDAFLRRMRELPSWQSKLQTTRKTSSVRPLWWYIATWFGTGLAPKMSGTVGSLAALPVAFLIQIKYGNTMLFCASISLFLAGWWASDRYLQEMEGDDDPREIVVDEVAGQWLLLSVLFPTFNSYLAGFALFRIFDIVKPWPVSYIDQKIKGGIGVMLDDMVAAIYPVLIYFFLLLEARLLGSQTLLLPLMNFLGGM